MDLKNDLSLILDHLEVSSLYGAHVFVDYSNILYGANKYSSRFDENLFFQFLNNTTAQLPQIKRILVSSIEVEAQKHGFEVHELPKHRNKEYFVDELLYSKICESLLDYESGLLVLVTGDGNISRYGLGFSMNILRALKRNWKVRLITWKKDTNTIYIDIACKYSNFKIFYLDNAIQHFEG